MTELVEYLTAKRDIDDRALNRRVWGRFAEQLVEVARDTDRPLRIVEVGTGVGSMIARLAEWETVPGTVSYRAVDLNEACIAAARDRVPKWLSAAGYEVETASGTDIVAEHPTASTRFELSLEVADARRIVDDADAVVAAAFLDIVDPDRILRSLREVVADRGVIYAPCTFDGATHFTPPEPNDGRIERLYHRHMDELREQPGSSRAGRAILDRAPDHGYDVDAVGGGDWVVHPGDEGYSDSERVFLRHLVETIDGALTEYPTPELDPSVRRAWIESRTNQCARGELTMIAHHLDLLLRAGSEGA